MGQQLEEFVSRLIALSTVGPEGVRRLPPERELGEALDLSRGALRERLSQLDSLGVLRRRQGHGSYLDTPDVEFLRTYFMLMRKLGHLGDEEFSQARAMLEEVMAAGAASCVKDTDVEVLRGIVAVMVAHTGAGEAEEALQADLDFHSRIYQIVDNPIFNMLNQGFAHVLRDNMQLRRNLAMSLETPAVDGSYNTDTVHYEIVNALAARDPDAARSAMRRHFADFSLLALMAQAGPVDPDTRGADIGSRTGT